MRPDASSDAHGKVIALAGKRLNMQIVTVGHWTAAEVMDHEWLFWETYMKQLEFDEMNLWPPGQERM